MRSQEIEAWALSVVRRVTQGQSVEDVRVEAKREYPPSDKAARRIAGHANAARSDSILWIIGLDEREGVVPYPTIDFAAWWAQVQACFEGVPPGITELGVPTSGGAVTALLVDATRAPFVVRNPQFGKEGGGPVEFEVPWREATSVRSARRGDLLELLVPAATLPDIDLLQLRVMVPTKPGGSPNVGDVQGHIYLAPRTVERLTFPFHQCGGELKVGEHTCAIGRLFLGPPPSPNFPGLTGPPGTLTMANTQSELVVEGPGKVHLTASFETPTFDGDPPQTGSIRLTLKALPPRRACIVETVLRLRPADPKVSAYVWDGEVGAK